MSVCVIVAMVVGIHEALFVKVSVIMLAIEVGETASAVWCE